MTRSRIITRREFVALGAAATAAAGGVAWWRGRSTPVEQDVFDYDLSAFEQTDPALLQYSEEAKRASPTLARPTCLAVSDDDLIGVGGDSAIHLYDATASPTHTIELDEVPHALAFGPESQLAVAFQQRVEIRSREGKLIARHQPLGERTYLTSIAFLGNHLFLADAGNREGIRCDLDGEALLRFGRRGSNTDAPGFVVPSPYFQLGVAPDGNLRIANPGRHRVETYNSDGEFLNAWGEPSMAIEGFAGCCNPTHFCVLPNGKVVTSEKGLNRIKVYDALGRFESVVAGAEHLVEDPVQARRACADCRIGYSLPVAADSAGRILALDPASSTIRFFRPLAG